MRLIDADALKSKLQARHDNGNDDFDKGYNIGLGTAIDLIDSATTVETEQKERPQGEWIWLCDNPNPKYNWSCNKCGRGVKEQENFCPNCGVAMRKVVQNDTIQNTN